MKKTVREWLSLIADPIIREKAIANFEARPRFKYGCKNVNAAILFAFWWEETAEGYDYWERIYYSEIQLLEEPAN